MIDALQGYICVPPGLPDDEESRLEAIRTTALFQPSAAPILQEIVARARDALDVEFAGVTIVRSTDQQILASTEGQRDGGSREASFCGHAILVRSDITFIPDAREDMRFKCNPYVLGPPHIRFYAASPIAAASGEVLGALCVYDKEPRAWLKPQDRDALRACARAVERLR